MKTKIETKKEYEFDLKKDEQGCSIIAGNKFYFHKADAPEVDRVLSKLPKGHIITIKVILVETE